jgi:hypothetical protein
MHGEIYGLMNFMAPRTQADGNMRLEWGLPGEVLDSTVQLAILASREPYLQINHVMDWGKLEKDLWADHLGKVLILPERLVLRQAARLGSPCTPTSTR